MREIKFRAWDGKMMIDDVWTWDKSSNHFGHYNEFHENWMYGLGVENVTLMQFTGLKDKTGKEIYEGDIVEYENGNCGYGRSRHEEISRDAIPEITQYEDFVDGATWWAGGEVVGNIHENPELLQ